MSAHHTPSRVTKSASSRMAAKSSGHSAMYSKPTHHRNGRQSGISAVVVLLAALVVVAAVVIYLFLQMNQLKTTETVVDQNGQAQVVPTGGGLSALAALFQKKAPVAAPTPTPILVPTMPPLPLPKGEQEYAVTTASEFTGPKFTRAWFSDFSTPQNVPQTVKVYINKATPASKVTAVLSTDTKSVPLTLTQQADANGEQAWSGQWTLTDTVEKNFVFKFSADGANGHSEFSIAAR